MLAAVLWIGNIDFDSKSATEVDPVAIKDPESKDSARRVATLLDLN